MPMLCFYSEVYKQQLALQQCTVHTAVVCISKPNAWNKTSTQDIKELCSTTHQIL